MDDGKIIKAVGQSEAINISEFKQSEKLCYKIKVEEQSESVDSKLGRQLTLNHILQYASSQMGPQDIGRVLKNMPFVNNENIFDDLTIDQDNVDNDMLALERGDIPEQPSPYANNEYYVNRLTHRMKQADYKTLDPKIQQGYQLLMQEHQLALKDKQQAAIDAKNEYIPVGGALITCSMRVKDPSSPDKSMQVRLPYQALDWLIQTLEKQGMSLDKLQTLDPGVVKQMGSVGNQQQQNQSQLPTQQGVAGQMIK